MQPDMIIRWTDVFSNKYDGGHRVYVMYGDDDVCLYVGQSRDAGDRLLSHVGRGPFDVSSAGRWVIDHRPQSHNWKIALYIPVLSRNAHPLDRLMQDVRVDDVESLFIYEMSPVFNAQGKKRSLVMPRRYVERSEVANEGMV